MGPFCLCSALPVVCFVAGIYNVFPSFIEDVMRLAGEIEKKKTKKSSACTGGALYRPLIKVSLRVSRLTGKYVVCCLRNIHTRQRARRPAAVLLDYSTGKEKKRERMMEINPSDSVDTKGRTSLFHLLFPTFCQLVKHLTDLLAHLPCG